MSDDRKSNKDLKYLVVALPGVGGDMPVNGKDEQEAAKVFYVVATRATQRLVNGVGRFSCLNDNTISQKIVARIIASSDK